MEDSQSLTLPRVVRAEHLVGSVEACKRYKIDRSTLVRRIAAGIIVPLAQINGDNGQYVFDVNELPDEVAS
jgi:hypothetical protein